MCLYGLTVDFGWVRFSVDLLCLLHLIQCQNANWWRYVAGEDENRARQYQDTALGCSG